MRKLTFIFMRRGCDGPNEKSSLPVTRRLLCLRWQGYQDSNLNKQIQNLLCCHYTISLGLSRFYSVAVKSIRAAGTGGQLPFGRLHGFHPASTL